MPTDPGIVQAVLELYGRTFPTNERRSDEAIRRSIESPSYRLMVKQRADQLAGFALLFIPPGEAFALLEYLAVEPNEQGRGIGTSIVKDCIAAVGERFLLAETESALLGEQAIRRLKFYNRLGFQDVIGLDYILPIGSEPPPMMLMICPSAPHPAMLRRWLSRIYRDVYGCKADDSRISQMLADEPMER